MSNKVMKGGDRVKNAEYILAHTKRRLREAILQMENALNKAERIRKEQSVPIEDRHAQMVGLLEAELKIARINLNTLLESINKEV